MKDESYWKSHYVWESDINQIERKLSQASFDSKGEKLKLIYFEKDRNIPNIIISPGSGGHSYVFAELGYQMYLRGFNVFIMPKHGGHTINQLVSRHKDVLNYVSQNFNNVTGIFGEGLGRFATFYLALAHGPVKSIVCQNSPGILTEEKFQRDIVEGKGGAANRRKRLFPLFVILSRLFPKLKMPISLYLDWRELIDINRENRNREISLVDSYMKDRDFDKWYPLSAIISLVRTHPENNLEQLNIPTMFLVPVRGWSNPSYVKDLYMSCPGG